MFSSRAICAVLVAFTTLSCCACSRSDRATLPTPEPSLTDAKAPKFPNWPTVADDFRFHWSAAPGVDLLSGPAVALRAYVESYRLAGFAGGDPKVVYPGFDRATPRNTDPTSEPGSLLQLRNVRPLTRSELEAQGWTYAERSTYGYQPTFVLGLEQVAGHYRATVCLGLYAVYQPADDKPGRFVSTVADPKTGQPTYGRDGDVEIWRVELAERGSQAEGPSAAATAPAQGPLPAPTEDVFGSWSIAGRASGSWGPLGADEQIETPGLRQQCEAAMPDDAATRRAMATGFHDAPPPHGEPIPGWPAASG